MPTNRFIVIVTLFAELCFNQACHSGKRQIEYVFPDGFRGPAVIRENQKDGIPACEVPWLPRTTVCTLRFPSSGVLNIQGESPGKLWHWAAAHYANGTVIPVPNTPAGVKVSKDEIALWTFGSVQNGEDWLFIGTEDQFRKFRDEKH